MVCTGELSGFAGITVRRLTNQKLRAAQILPHEKGMDDVLNIIQCQRQLGVVALILPTNCAWTVNESFCSTKFELDSKGNKTADRQTRTDVC